MEAPGDRATSSRTKTTNITSVEIVSNLNNNTVITITGMECKFCSAALHGNNKAFQGKSSEEIESILTPNKNTILHVHLTNYTGSVSETFVEEVLLKSPGLLLKTNVKGETILHIAARYGHHEIVKNIIDWAKVLPQDGNGVGAEKRLIRAINDKKDTALHEAARFGHKEVVDVLIKEEPEHSYFGKNVDDETPLYIAVERQHWKVVNALYKINLPQYDGPNGRTALHAAVIHGGKGEVLQLLTRNLSAAKEADENGCVPLHLAALFATPNVVELLVTRDRSTAYMRDKKGRTALHFAALREDTSVMKRILKHCPDCCELVDEKGSNALHYTTMGRRFDMFEERLNQILKDTPLISSMCNEKDNDGNTPLHLVARDAVKVPVAYAYHPSLEGRHGRVDKMACNKYGQTAVDIVPPHAAFRDTMIKTLESIGARFGGRVPDKQLRE